MTTHDEYISRHLNPILHQLTLELVREKPSNPTVFLIDLLQKRLGVSSGISEKEELRLLRQEMARLKHKAHHHGSEDEKSASDSEESFVEEEKLKPKKENQRSGVSAEVYGTWNKKEDFKPVLIKKTDDQKARLESILGRIFMFAELDDKEKEIVIDAMKECNFPSNSEVIKQGQDGGELFVIDSGHLSCYKRINNEEKLLKEYEPGQCFGELSLLYNVPRAATIIAKTDSLLWSLDRSTFNHIVKDAAVKRRDRYESFLSKVDLLSDMDPYERSQLADALVSKKFEKDAFIIREGEEGNDFFIIEEGEALATKTIHPGHPPEQVKKYSPGEYFGELSLIKGQPRAANVIASTAVKCVSLDRYSFKRLLGPLEGILERNAKKYEEIIAKLI
jgi:cAMP-dependent protein kinase regulator